MPDFRAVVRQNLRLPDVAGAEESEVVEELALDFESRYNHALSEGLDPEQTWRIIIAQTDWPKIANELCAVLPHGTTSESNPGKRYKPVQNQLNDIRLAVRMLRKSPAFTATVLATIALCLGANLTIFAVVDSILLRPLPFPDASRLVTAVSSYPKGGTPPGGNSLPNYYAYREELKLSLLRPSPWALATMPLSVRVARPIASRETACHPNSSRR